MKEASLYGKGGMTGKSGWLKGWRSGKSGDWKMLTGRGSIYFFPPGERTFWKKAA